MPTLLRGVVHDRRDDDDRTALTQPRSQSAQDARSRLDERSTQTQGDQVVAAFFPRGRAGQRVMFDVQAQPAHPSRLGVLRTGPDEGTWGEVDRVDAISHPGRLGGEFTGSGSDVEGPSALGCRDMLGQ